MIAYVTARKFLSIITASKWRLFSIQMSELSAMCSFIWDNVDEVRRYCYSMTPNAATMTHYQKELTLCSRQRQSGNNATVVHPDDQSSLSKKSHRHWK